jgi:hypothetical protein
MPRESYPAGIINGYSYAIPLRQHFVRRKTQQNTKNE